MPVVRNQKRAAHSASHNATDARHSLWGFILDAVTSSLPLPFGPTAVATCHRWLKRG